MDRAMLEDHLTHAERHVREGERHVREQRSLVERLELDGHDAGSARELLTQFEELLRLHIADRDRLQAELGSA